MTSSSPAKPAISAPPAWPRAVRELQHVAERNGWTPFISMQDQYNLINRGEELEMFGLLADQGVGSIPWSPLAQGVVTRPWDDRTTNRGATGTDRFGRPCGSTATRPSSTPSNASPKHAGCRWLRLRWRGR